MQPNRTQAIIIINACHAGSQPLTAQQKLQQELFLAQQQQNAPANPLPGAQHGSRRQVQQQQKQQSQQQEQDQHPQHGQNGRETGRFWNWLAQLFKSKSPRGEERLARKTVGKIRDYPFKTVSLQ